jgi:putative ABC transport system permease protein
VAPTVRAQVTAVAGDASHTPQSFFGVTADYATITNRNTSSGTLLTEEDITARRRVAVIGQTVADNLFGDQSAVGRQVRFGRSTYEIIGVLERKGTGFEGDADDTVLAPLTSVQDTITGRLPSYDTIYAAAVSREQTSAAAQQITDVLLTEHGLTDPEQQDFEVFDPAELLAQASQTSTIFTVLLGAIASISLVVGGIGVMNIMLVTVTERTREIGIRKALGARRSDLLIQFLFEAVVVTAVGGLLGIGLGLLGSLIRLGEFSPVVQPWSVALAFGVSVAIGLFFGIYPANRAARLRPIDALRYE